MRTKANSKALFIFLVGILIAAIIGHYSEKTWLEQAYIYDVYQTENDQPAYKYKGKEVIISEVVAYQDSPLNQHNLNQINDQPELAQQWVRTDNQLSLLKPAFHFGIWSLLPAFITITLCLITREPLTSLFGGIVIGAFMLGEYDLTGSVIIPNLAKEGTAGLLLLYLWLLGGLLGIWTKTGAAQAFAQFILSALLKVNAQLNVLLGFLVFYFFKVAL
jgi:hypothetical protein